MQAEISGIKEPPEPNLFRPHPNLDDSINAAICQSEIDGGVHLDDLFPGAILHIRTRNNTYKMEYKGNGQAMISGHPEICPEPVLFQIHGSTYGTPMLWLRFIGRGMRLELGYPEGGNIVLTSTIQEIKEISPGQPLFVCNWTHPAAMQNRAA